MEVLAILSLFAHFSIFDLFFCEVLVSASMVCYHTSGYNYCIFLTFSVFIAILMIILSRHVFSSEKTWTNLCHNCRQIQDSRKFLPVGPLKRYTFIPGIGFIALNAPPWLTSQEIFDPTSFWCVSGTWGCPDPLPLLECLPLRS